MGGPEMPPPPPEILKLSMVTIVVPSILATYFYMLLDVIKMLFGKFVPDCIRSNLRVKIFLRVLPPDLPSRHARLCVCGHALTRHYHPATVLFFPLPTQNPI